jgi:hypothetical protein
MNKSNEAAATSSITFTHGFVSLSTQPKKTASLPIRRSRKYHAQYKQQSEATDRSIVKNDSLKVKKLIPIEHTTTDQIKMITFERHRLLMIASDHPYPNHSA